MEYAPNSNVTCSSRSPRIDCKMPRAILASALTLRFWRFEKLYTVCFADDSAFNINRSSYSTVCNTKLASDGNLDNDERITSGKSVPLRKSSRVVNFLK